MKRKKRIVIISIFMASLFLSGFFVSRPEAAGCNFSFNFISTDSCRTGAFKTDNEPTAYVRLDKINVPQNSYIYACIINENGQPLTPTVRFTSSTLNTVQRLPYYNVSAVINKKVYLRIKTEGSYGTVSGTFSP